ncbi:MAG: hypothetical protein JXA78_16330 [Anaerolineales bacterium]|nr:hypothetical protein [Anaerolineales bacterium]
MKSTSRSRRWTTALLLIVTAFTWVIGGCLPKKSQPIPFAKVTPIWPHSSEPAAHEVALFRHEFSASSALGETALQIFADTRYELWIDGEWIGRGPARFSQTLREYDVFELGAMPPGNHLIAVLVQWAPNARRAKSYTPFLKAQLLGRVAEDQVSIAVTGEQWRSLISNAWRQDARLVDTRKLIGPTELLDFSQLPPDWNQPGYDSRAWQKAVTKDISSIDNKQAIQAVYEPRSIPFPIDEPVPITIQDAGVLSPDFSIGEIAPGSPNDHNLPFFSSEPTLFTIELLTETLSLGGAALLDGEELSWEAAGPRRPDVYRASVDIESGPHQVTFTNVPLEGATFSLSRENISFEYLPFDQGIHVGRRWLLADPTSDSTHVSVARTSNSLNVEFDSPPGYVVLDLGRTVHGRLSADVTGPPGSIVDIGWDERIRAEAQRPLPYMGSLYPQWSQVDSWILDGETHQVQTIDARAGRFIVITAWGNAPIEVNQLRVFEERYPVTQVGEFRSSDPLLNEIWQVGIDSLLPNMTDAYTDTPWRERGQWWGDAYVEERINRIAFGDTRLIRRGITLVADELTRFESPAMAPNNNNLHMLDYTMLWVLSLAEYIQQTQDQSVLETSYPAVAQFMNHLEIFENPSTHLLDLPQKPWARTAYIESFGHHSRYGQSTALNALYRGALLAAADLASQKNASDAARNWREKADEVKSSANALLFLPHEHRYLSTVFNGVAVEPSPHAQAWSIVYGLAPESELDQVTASLLELLSPGPANPPIHVYGMFWVLEALGKTGHTAQALEIIKLYYGYLLEKGATTWWENFTADQRPSDSYSHGWGGSPSWFLSTYVLGVRELEPDKWIAEPAFDSIAFASGVLPLQNGALRIQWEHQECGVVHIQIVSEDTSNGSIVLPFEDASLSITLNGEIIWQSGKPLIDAVKQELDHITIELDGGEYDLLLQQTCLTARRSP